MTWPRWLQAGVGDLPALDDFAMCELTPAQADDLYELNNERANRSLILTSNHSPVEVKNVDTGVCQLVSLALIISAG